MPRLMGVDIPGKKHIRYALRYIHGIGPKRADDVLAACKVEPSKKADDLTQDEIHAIVTFIQDHFRVEGDLRREVSQNIRRLMQIGSYRGLRHKRGLPVRGVPRAPSQEGPSRARPAHEDERQDAQGRPSRLCRSDPRGRSHEEVSEET